MNSVNITGRVGSDIELRYTPTGKAVCEVTLAVDDGFGENKRTAWVGVTIWGATAETARKYVGKGDLLGISGRLTQDEWEDKATGKKQRKTRVTCEQMTLLPNHRAPGATAQARDTSAQPREGSRSATPPPRAEAPTGWDNEADDDIPF